MITQVLHCPYCQGTDIVGMVRRLKASNATAAGRVDAVVGARFSSTIPMSANRLQ